MNKKDLTILVVGNKDLTELVSIIRSLGHEKVIETNDGTSAWNLLKNDNSVDMVFADWHLGQFDGVVLSKLMMSDPVLRSIPTVLVSSSINRQMALDAGNAGVSGLVVKPFSDYIIKNKIEILCEIEGDEEVKAEELFQSGTKYFEEGDHEKALEEFSGILKLYENPEVYYNIGYIKAAQQKYDESIIAFRKAITIDQTFAKAYKALGEVYSKIGLTDKAKEVLQQAGEIYMEQNLSQEAELAFNEVIKLNPNTTNIYNSLAILYRKEKEYEKAIQTYKKALMIDSEDENILFNLGRAYFDSKEYKNAKEIFKKAHDLYPDFQEAKLMYDKTVQMLKEKQSE